MPQNHTHHIAGAYQNQGRRGEREVAGKPEDQGESAEARDAPEHNRAGAPPQRPVRQNDGHDHGTCPWGTTKDAKPGLQPKESGHASPARLVAESESGDRGRDAASPSDIPVKGWKDILWRVYSNISDHRILALAAGMTYYSILAIFPALAALVAIYGLFSDPATIARHLDEISGFIPGGAVDVAREQLTRVASKGNQALGFTFAIGLIVTLWSANAAMKASRT